MSGLLTTYEWRQLPWRKLEVAVFKLQKRIYKASQAGDKQRVHQLQRLLLKSKAAKFIAVRRVTQDNQGKHTAGVDGIKSLTPNQRLNVAQMLETLPTGRPARRLWIPKAGTDEQRPLSIPTLFDRAHQTLVKQALEPEWEAKFEPNSYGFRPGRSVHDAIGAIFLAICKQPKYVLDADIAKCFDNIDRETLLRKMDTFPTLQRRIKDWLSAGIIDNGVFMVTEQGTQQGSPLSPLLANIALHGLETYLQSQFPGRHTVRDKDNQPIRQGWKPKVIRYADDLVILHRDKSAIEQCQTLTQTWLADIGLELNPAKTRISHTLQAKEQKAGFTFLGFEVRQHTASQYNTHGNGFKTLIKPSKKAIKRHYQHLAETISRHKTARQENLIRQLNPIIAGWGNYYRAVVSKKVFQTLDQMLYHRLARWARHRHPKKGRRWIANRYWTATQGRQWGFGQPNGPTLNQHAKVAIKRHIKVRGEASPYDGHWSYWATRRGHHPGVPKRLMKLLKRQQGRCQACGLVFTPQAIIETHHRDGDHNNNRHSNLTAVHRHCHDQIHGGYQELSQGRGTHDKSLIN